MPSGYVPGEVGHHDQWAWPQPYVRYAELIADGRGLATWGTPFGHLDGVWLAFEGGRFAHARLRRAPSADAGVQA
ncbi:hypothetical protein [Streptomyces sp. 6N223]|uniref:hypothetical protein n=1 Tax=Streptomyces sp. 6N223 TaxID=3457412 RepID=UPI003FD39D4C